jgi:hypothetical protein
MKTRALACVVALFWLVEIIPAADVTTYALIKSRTYNQTNATDAVLGTNAPFQFIALVDANPANVTSANVETPLSTFYALTNNPGIGAFAVSRVFTNQAALDAVFPNGSYTFTINAVNDGTQIPTIELNGNLYPAAPRVTNYAAAQLLRPSSNFTVQWTPFTGGTTNDNIVLSIRLQGGSNVFATPVFGQPGALNGAATSVVVSAGTFATGTVYNATLTFAKVAGVNIFQYLGVPGVSAYVTATDLRMRAISAPLLTITNTPSGAAQLRFNSDPGRPYDIRASADLANWNSLAVTTAVANTTLYLDTNAPPLTNRFYRLQEP